MAMSAGARGGGRLPLVLASSSPQRHALLQRLGVPFSVRVPETSELCSGDPLQLARENALRKARAALAPGVPEVVVGCDTLVALDGVIYGKPADERQAADDLVLGAAQGPQRLPRLALLFGAEQGRERTAIARTGVAFRELSDELLAWYLATGEWRGRAGAYAIQGAGAALVRSVRGDYENVVGLPLASLLDLYPELLTP